MPLVLLTSLCRSQNWNKEIISKRWEKNLNDSVLAEGILFNGMKYGRWDYYYSDKKFFKTTIYSIDSFLHPDLTGKIKFDLKTRYDLDTTLLSYTELAFQDEDSEDNSRTLVSSELPVFELYPTGIVHHKIIKEDGACFYITYDSLGKIESKETISKGNLEGKYWLYFSNGGNQSKGNMNAGRLNGEVIWYKEDGTIRERKIYKNGKEVK